MLAETKAIKPVKNYILYSILGLNLEPKAFRDIVHYHEGNNDEILNFP